MAVIMLCAMMATTGCQTSGKVVSTQQSEVCPTCKRQTVTTPIKGQKYTRHVCPKCETVYGYDASVTYDELEDDMGAIHVCHYCKANVVTCSQCSRQ